MVAQLSSKVKEQQEKILEAFAYIAERAHKKNSYNLLKVFYLADKLHMERYGRFIFSDEYAAMAKGPVPSLAYDLLKSIRSGHALPNELKAKVYVSCDHNVGLISQFDDDLFSDSDLECIDEIINMSKTRDLGDVSHDTAWEKTPRNAIMSTSDIIDTLHNSKIIHDLHINRHA